MLLIRKIYDLLILEISLINPVLFSAYRDIAFAKSKDSNKNLRCFLSCKHHKSQLTKTNAIDRNSALE